MANLGETLDNSEAWTGIMIIQPP